MGLGGVCHRMVMGYTAGSPGEGLRVIFDLKLGSLSRRSGVGVRGMRRTGRPGPLVQLERREANVVRSIPARSPIPKARAAAL
jgi:hypothetical protein